MAHLSTFGMRLYSINMRAFALKINAEVAFFFFFLQFRNEFKCIYYDQEFITCIPCKKKSCNNMNLN